MICQQCSTQNEISARFCTRCGSVLVGRTAAEDAATDQRSRGAVGVWIVGGLCLLYLVNPTLGVFELIPDNLPLIGNLDELTASAGFLWALKGMGVRLPGF
ncbi:MAG: DUF1232 domain-containing protein [Caldilineaceae bacterium]|nr:DUF1232 domain-containing protein [Caldilineaceae bacterium]